MCQEYQDNVKQKCRECGEPISVVPYALGAKVLVDWPRGFDGNDLSKLPFGIGISKHGHILPIEHITRAAMMVWSAGAQDPNNPEITLVKTEALDELRSVITQYGVQHI